MSQCAVFNCANHRCGHRSQNFGHSGCRLCLASLQWIWEFMRNSVRSDKSGLPSRESGQNTGLVNADTWFDQVGGNGGSVFFADAELAVFEFWLVITVKQIVFKSQISFGTACKFNAFFQVFVRQSFVKNQVQVGLFAFAGSGLQTAVNFTVDDFVAFLADTDV